MKKQHNYLKIALKYIDYAAESINRGQPNETTSLFINIAIENLGNAINKPKGSLRPAINHDNAP